jgi:hypothetical protein
MDHPDAFAAIYIKVLAEAVVLTGLSSCYRNTSWDDNPDLFSLKIGWNIARVFVM